MRRRLRDHTGAWYDPDPRRPDRLTRLREAAAKVEADTGVVIIVARARLPVRIGPFTFGARMFEVAVADHIPGPVRAGWTRVRTASSAADIIRGIGLGARATGRPTEREHRYDR